MTITEIVEHTDDRFKVSGYDGIAFYFHSLETRPDSDTEWTGIERETGNVLMVMVGDDRRHSVDPDDIELIPEDGYCPSCGQIGCMAYR